MARNVSMMRLRVEHRNTDSTFPQRVLYSRARHHLMGFNFELKEWELRNHILLTILFRIQK